MTAEDIKNAGIPLINPDDTELLMAQSAIEYIKANTTLEVDADNLESIKALPASAKLFVVKYTELMRAESGISSESLGGMSQSFDTSGRDKQLFTLLNSLLGSYAKSQLRFKAASRRWENGY